jgi:predicted cation transporter
MTDMNSLEAAAILIVLLFAPVMLAPVERNLEACFFALGIIAVTLGGLWEWQLARHAATEPIPITIAVIVAGSLFGLTRERLDRGFVRMRAAMPRSILTALTIFTIGILSSVITAIIAALLLVEMAGLLRLGQNMRGQDKRDQDKRDRVVIIGCFAIGFGSALTPLGGPLATLAASALKLPFTGLFNLLIPYALPGIVAMSILSGVIARGEYSGGADTRVAVGEDTGQALVQGLKVFAFVAGLVLVSEAYAPLARRYVTMLGADALFWANITSAALDNTTLVALEFHDMDLDRAREALISLLIAGGMLIPGNIPNIISAGVLRIGSGVWARTGVPLGLLMLGIYFAVLKFLR